MSDTKVVILAAGKGKRMQSEVPKPLVKIAGKPMIDQLLERVEKAGITSKPVVVVSQDGQHLFRDELGDRVDYALQTEQLGTGHAVKSAKQACGDAQHILVLYGDHPFIQPKAIARLLKLSQKNPEALVMLTAEVPSFEGNYANFISWSRVIRDDSGKIVDNKEYKDASEAERQIHEVNPCIFVFPAAWLWENLEKITNKNASGEYYLTDLVKIAIATHKEIVTETVDPLQVMGINTPEELSRAEKIFASL